MRFQGKATYIVECDFDVDEDYFGWEEDVPTQDDVENEMDCMADIADLEGAMFTKRDVKLVDVEWRKESTND